MFTVLQGYARDVAMPLSAFVLEQREEKVLKKCKGRFLNCESNDD